jgi:4-amino-4-deoxy-L-arabinose transferase-like glycosyltransferase
MVATTGVLGATALGAVLRFSGFAHVQPNPYYDAAVRSMSQSWHNFFYGAFEPSAQVSVDKIPVDLWLQVASVKLFGFSSTALRLPEALAATLAIPLLYAVVARLFGRGAGIAAALALAVLPVSVLTGRSDTMDSMMMAVLVGAAWLIVAGAQRGRTWQVVAGGAMAGLAFNVKLFEAVIAFPALLVLAFLLVDGSRRRRARVMGATVLACALSSLSWLIAWSLLPGRKPFPIGSTTGSAWNVVFGFNGIDRLHSNPSAHVSSYDPTGALRLFTSSGRGYSWLIGGVLAAALVLGALALLDAFATSRSLRAATPETRTRHAGIAWLGVWLLTGLLLFSAMGVLQVRYLEAFTPAVAAVVGVAIAALATAAIKRPRAAFALVAGAALGAVLAPGATHTPAWAAPVALGAAVVTGIVALTMSVAKPQRRALAPLLAVAALAAVLAQPLAASTRVAGGAMADSGHPGQMPAARITALSTFLTANQGSARYEVATAKVAKAGPLIVRDGRPVLVLTSMHNLPLVTPAQLAGAVRAGHVRYLMLGGAACPAKGCAPAVRWARSHSVDISLRAGLDHPHLLYQFTGAATKPR